MSRAGSLARAFGSDGTLNASDVSGLAAVASSGSASDLSTGTLPIDRIADTSVTAAKLHTTAVTDKLGYTPLNKGGDTMSGPLGMGQFLHASNSGEARLGRADDRVVGISTLQLGGTNGRFEIVDKDWSDALFSVDEAGVTWVPIQTLHMGQGATIGVSAYNGMSKRSFAVTRGENWANGASYVHILLPSRYNNSSSRMFQLLIQGYALDVTANRNINLMISGYVTTNSNGGPISSISVWDATGQYSPAAYYSSNYNRGVARFYLASKYYTTFVVDALQAGNGDVILPGECEVIWSTSSTI